jgi:hypothetical protein
MNRGRPKLMKDGVVAHFYIPIKDKEELKKWSTLSGLSVSELMRQFIAGGLSSLSKGKSESYSNIRKNCQERLSSIENAIIELKASKSEIINTL